MTAKIDVLAVMDGVIARMRVPGTAEQQERELREARAAVAELVEAARHFRRMHDVPDGAGTALDAALAKFGGGQ